MRILAQFRAEDGFQQGLDELRQFFAEHSLLPVEDPEENVQVVKQLVEDMSEQDRHRFQRTVRHVAMDPIGGTVLSVSELPERHLLIRLRHSTLQSLMPCGHSLIDDVLRAHGPQGSEKFELHACEVRERGNHEGFLQGSWVGGESNFLRFLTAQRRAWFIIALFIAGLVLEIVFSLWQTTSDGGQLMLRLGAPMLVSSLVLILERLAQWRDQRDPRLRWTTNTGRHQIDPFAISPNGDG